MNRWWHDENMSPNILVWPTMAPRNRNRDDEETIVEEEDENNSILDGNGYDTVDSQQHVAASYQMSRNRTSPSAARATTTSTDHPHTPVTIITNTPPRRLQLWDIEQEDNHEDPERAPWPILRIPMFGESSATSSLRYNSYWSDTESSSSSSYSDDEDSKSGYDPSEDDDDDELDHMESDAAFFTPRRPTRNRADDLQVYLVVPDTTATSNNTILDLTDDHQETQGINQAAARQPPVILLPRIEGDPTSDSWITTTADDRVLQVLDHAEAWNEERSFTVQDHTSAHASSQEPFAIKNREDDPLRSHNQSSALNAISEQLHRRTLSRRHSMCSRSSSNSSGRSSSRRDLQDELNTSSFMATSSQRMTTQHAIQASFLPHRRHSMGCIPLLAV
jgi:hypothetical protein